jgi:uncharacterized protein (DUF305 family)
MKKFSLIIIVILLILFGWLLADRYKYGAFIHQWWMQNMWMHWFMGWSDMMQHVDISSEEEFIKHMIPHHQEAVDTASRVSSITQNAELKLLTDAIVLAQQDEINMMESRLQDWYSTGTLQVIYEPMMRDTSTISAITTIEKMWLEDMIHHHMGAVMMAKNVLRLDSRPEVVSFAREVITAQSNEIVLMRKMLRNY